MTRDQPSLKPRVKAVASSPTQLKKRDRSIFGLMIRGLGNLMRRLLVFRASDRPKGSQQLSCRRLGDAMVESSTHEKNRWTRGGLPLAAGAKILAEGAKGTDQLSKRRGARVPPDRDSLLLEHLEALVSW